ncbi:MAG TPA: cytochrome c oxidase assembly protein [Actinomycetales bacterium]
MATLTRPRTTTGPAPVALGLPVVAGIAALVVGLLLTGATAATVLGDPGALTRWGLPVTRTLADLAAALTIGLLVVASYALPAGGWRHGEGTDGGSAVRRRQGDDDTALAGVTLTATRVAGATGVVWVLLSLVTLALTFSRIAGAPVTAEGFAEQLSTFATELTVLRAMLVSTLLAAVAATGAALATKHTTVGWMAVVSLLALAPLALTGHAAGTASHELAVDSLALHLVGVTVWIGGLGALVLLRSRLGGHAASAVSRYSTLAAWCFAMVTVSGLVNGYVRVGSLAGLQTTYGALLVAKAVVLVALGLAGWRHRASLVARLTAGSGGAFWRLAAGELALMGVATGLGVALSASAPPVPDVAPQDTSAAETITGFAMPGPLTSLGWLTQWRVDLLWLTVVLLLAGGYLVGVVRLARRGDGWPVLRTLAWLTGCLVLLWVTNGAPGIYGRVLFSAHMLGHMTLTMVVPPLLVLGGPISLALRAMNGRRDGSRGPREWLMVIVHSRLLTLLSNPVVAAGIFAGSLIVFYYSPLFELALRTHTGHVLMLVHFLLAGYLFASVLIGVDPGPPRAVFPLRLLVLFATMGFHAFFGVALMQGSELLAPDVLGVLDRTWGRSPLDDQQYGGGVAWALGELPTVMLGMGVAWAWVRSDDRESRRSDRTAERDGDAELAEYNARLAALAARGAGPGAAPGQAQGRA